MIPLYLNRKYFHQQARAMMEDKQMVKYTFFKRLGAFSINLDEPRSSVSSLRYALKSVQNPGSALYIYPEGKLMNPSSQKPDFKAGLTWLYKKTSEVDFVPVAIFIDHSKGNKPELHIKIGSNVKPDKSMESKRLTTLFEESLQMLLTEVKDKERL